MTKTEAKQEQFSLAFHTLKRAFELSHGKTGEDFVVFRDACIQRFEYCFDLSWKILKEKLFEVHGVSCISPKTCLEEAFAVHLIDESELWAKMTKWRNLTSHICYEQTADEVYQNLPAIIAAMEKLAGKV